MKAYKKTIAIGAASAIAAIVFLPVTKILVLSGIAVGGYYGYKALTK